MKLYPFSALLARMKYITRWSLMHSTRPESLSEHTCDTALLAHILCLIARRYTGTPCRPKTVAVAALYHDAPEIITGDMPTPVKYSSPGLRDAYKALEAESVRFHDPPAAGRSWPRRSVPVHLRQPADRRGKAAAESRRPALRPSSSAWRSSAAATTSLTPRFVSSRRRWKGCTALRPTGSWRTVCPASPRTSTS